MGREIRKVPPNWQHPKKKVERFVPGKGYRLVEDYRPLHDEAFAPAMREWVAQWEKWEAGEYPEHADAEDQKMPFWEWHGSPPDPDYYRPDWPEGTATWFQVYETVSEGTPVTPPFETKAELVEYLVANGDFWDHQRVEEGRRPGPAGWARDAAERFVDREFAVSMVVQTSADGAVEIKEPRDG